MGALVNLAFNLDDFKVGETLLLICSMGGKTTLQMFYCTFSDIAAVVFYLFTNIVKLSQNCRAGKCCAEIHCF